MKTTIQFFDQQFSRQVQQSQYELNPFELITRPYLAGEMLDFGCGLGNLSIAAAERGCRVLALDAAPSAIMHLRKVASERGLSIVAVEADLSSYIIESCFDAVVSIGLLMFFDRTMALAQLAQLMASARPGGIAAVNVLIEGTTYLDMFDPARYCLFGREELTKAFAGWDLLVETFDDFEAPRQTVKRFATVIARKKVSTR